MNIKELENFDREYITPTEAAGFLGVSAYSINTQFERNRADLGFPAARLGRNIRIPRLAFLGFLKGDYRDERRAEEEKQED